MSRPAAGVLLLLVCLVLAGCSTGGPVTAPEPTPERAPAAVLTAATPTVSPSPSPSAQTPPLDDWRVGARPLPLRPDGFGRVLPTPEELRVRRLPTRDLLPPPEDGQFRFTVGPVTPAVRRRMGQSWSPGCPVALPELRYVTVSFWGFDEQPHTGELVLDAGAARNVAGVFRKLYRARFPIEEMRLVTTADLAAPPTGDGNNTAATVCRAVRGQSEWSAHAYGLAVDVNPFQNPYQRDDLVLPELASAYLDRDWRRPGMIHPDGVVVDAFESIGWTWGGDFRTLTDSMHFSATGG
ncbi:MAG TPA: M15 family metallopeptidase [Nocardioidaceae bacterium]|nr:M15 family metallopeptidase [Nocardioidaceae bacterium]